LRQYVAFEVHAGRYFRHQHALRRQFHDAALRDIGDILSLRDGALAGKGDVLDLRDDLLHLAFLIDAKPIIGNRKLCAGIEEAGEHDFLRSRGDIHEAACACGHMRARRQPRNVHRAVAVYLQEGEQGGVKATRLKIGELVGRGHDRLGI
jgi:hypothetical protein